MDKVLIIDSDEHLLKKLKKRFSKAHQFKLLCAGDGDEAVRIMSGNPISVLITDINVNKIKILELLAFVSRKLPGTPCIVMSSRGKPWFYEASNQNETLYFIEKPVEISSLSSAILVALYMKDENSNGSISLKSFLPLLELESKTCRLEVQSSGNRKAYFYFDKGSLIDAHYRDLNPDAVVKEALNWKNINFRFSEFPQRRGYKRLNTPIMDLVSATWKKHRVLEKNKLEVDNAYLKPETSFIKQTIEKLLLYLTKRFKTIKGYKGIAILDKNFNLLASDQIEKKFNLQKFFRDVSSIYNNISPVFDRNGWERCKMLGFHTSNGIIHILESFELPINPIYLIGITESEGNWLFMKFELENFVKQLRKKLN